MNISDNILIVKDEEAVSREAAERFACAAVRGAAEHGHFFVAIPGGSSPRGMFEVLAADFTNLVPWVRVHIFFTDERYVSRESDDSNYKQANDLLLSQVPIPEHNIHRFPTELTPEEAVHDYERELIEVLGKDAAFDLVILGMGKDTHTASLFPNSPALEEQTKLAVAVFVESLGSWRLTLTIPALNNTREVIVLAFGEEKADAICEVFSKEPDPTLHPVQAIHSRRLLWILDRAAMPVNPGFVCRGKWEEYG